MPTPPRGVNRQRPPRSALAPARSGHRLVAMRAVTMACGIGAATISALASLGWILGIPVLLTFTPGAAGMKANISVALFATGVALVLSSRGKAPRACTAIGAAVAAIGAATLLEYLSGAQLGIDRLLASDLGATYTAHAGRMSPSSAAGALLCGVGLVCIDTGRRRARVAAWCGAITAAVALLGLVGYALGVSAYQNLGGLTRISLPSALALALLGPGIAASGELRMLAGDRPGATIARRLLPAGILVPLALGFALREGQILGWFDADVGTVLLVAGTILAVTYTILTGGRLLDRVDSEREAGDNQRLLEAQITGELLEGVCVARWSDSTIVYVNSRFEQMIGAEHGTLIGASTSIIDIVDEDRGPLAETARAAIVEHGHWTGEVEYRRAMGDRFRGQATVSGFDHPKHGMLSILVVADISALAQERTRLIEAQSIARLGSWMWDVGEDRVDWSDELCRIHGLEPSRSPKQLTEMLACVHPEDRVALRAAIEQTCADGESFTFKHRICRPDGSVRVVQTLGEVMQDDDGHVWCLRGTGQDVTERESLETRLRASGRHFELASDPALTAGFDGLVKSVNPALTQALGWSAEDLKARSFIELLHPDDRAESTRELERLRTGTTTVSFTNRFATGDGGYRWLDWNAISQPGDELIFASGRDITERIRADVALEASEQARRVLATALDAFVAMNADGSISDWNPQAEVTFGWSRAEVLGRDFAETFLSPGSQETYRRGLDQVTTGSQARILGAPMELVAVQRDGREFPVELAVSAHDTDAGRTVNAFLRDISDRRQAQREILRSERLLADLLDSAPDAVVITDELGRINLVNEQTELLFGYDRAELIGEPIEMLLPERFRQRHVGHQRHYQEAPTSRQMGVGSDIAGLRHDGTEFPASITLSAINTREGMLTTAFVRDITERKRVQDDLAKAHEVVVEASRMKSEFVANMSHEIRTPLNGVIGLSGLLLGTTLSDEQREYTEGVQAAGDALMSVIDGILDFSKIEAGKLELDNRPFDLREIVEGACAMLATAADERDIELMAWIDDGLPGALHGDGPRVRQVLANLLANAVKFTSVGEVVVQVSRHTTGADGVGLRFEVRDTGIGIDAESLTRIFDSFSQADSSTTRRFGGTGLGLAISKRLIELMGGEIGVESTPGEGSTFWFEVALTEAPMEEPAPEPFGLEGVRVLVVDDNATNRTILEHQLRAWGTTCTSAANATSALAMLRNAAEADSPYGLVVLDSKMPNVTGIELARAIRSRPELRTTRLLMASSSGNGRQAAIDAGVDGFVTKPVRHKRLRDEITRVLTAVEGVAPAPALPSAGTAAHRGRRRGPVLLAEDNPVNQIVAARHLEKRGYVVDVASNGREAVEMYARGDYPVVFMDCQMPELDGYEATAEIRRREGDARHTPIIAMTASTMQGDQERCIAAGMDNYLSKPLDLVLLDQILASIDVPLDMRPDGEPAPGEAGDVEGVVLDASQLADIADGDAGARDALVAMFVDQARAAVAEIVGAIASGDAATLQRAAHSLKGSSCVLGAERLSAISHRLCEAGSGQRLDDALGLRPELERTLELTVAALAAIEVRNSG